MMTNAPTYYSDKQYEKKKTGRPYPLIQTNNKHIKSTPRQPPDLTFRIISHLGIDFSHVFQSPGLVVEQDRLLAHFLKIRETKME